MATNLVSWCIQYILAVWDDTDQLLDQTGGLQRRVGRKDLLQLDHRDARLNQGLDIFPLNHITPRLISSPILFNGLLFNSYPRGYLDVIGGRN